MPWKDKVKAILFNYLPGQEHGHALVDLLSGDYNPSGRLTVTIPNKENEVGFTESQYPGVNGVATYSEKLQVGYRWYNARNVTPAFKFGHGLSYTTFTYSNIHAYSRSVNFTITNSGSHSGMVVSQLYITYPPEFADEPAHQLKGFTKTMIQTGQTIDATIKLTDQDLSIWDVSTHDWKFASGTFKFCIGDT